LKKISASLDKSNFDIKEEFKYFKSNKLTVKKFIKMLQKKKISLNKEEKDLLIENYSAEKKDDGMKFDKLETDLISNSPN